MRAARFISFWAGFCSLSLEIAWVRLFGFANLSTPKAFAFVLVIYLFGIAIGAQVGKWICQKFPDNIIKNISVSALFFAALVAAIGPAWYLYSKSLIDYSVIGLLGIFMTPFAIAILFPITHHLGTPRDSISESSAKGRNFSRVYLLNVIGGALGPLVTGYVLFEYLTLAQSFLFLAIVIYLTSLLTWFMFRSQINQHLYPMLFAFLSASGIAGLAYESNIDPHALVKEFSAVRGMPIVAVHEGRHGIITIAKHNYVGGATFEKTDHSVYGGNLYDGKVNVDLERNTNGLERPLALNILFPEAKRVLILGLSIGSWLTVVEGFPGVESIDVVEINPGYLALAREFGPQKRALEDKRVRVFVDDARRWLKFNPENRYDLILMNTTWHWRSNSAMLLSVEMMNLANRHLTDKGIVAFNATGSPDAFFTASTVFKETRRYENFIYGANWDPFSKAKDPAAWEVLRKVTIDGRPGFSENTESIEKFSKVPFVKIEEDIATSVRQPELITDDNMLVEYKYGRKF